MNVIKLPLESLKPAARNVRIHSQKQMQEYIRSIDKFGQTKPIVCDDEYNILAGNGLYEALKAKGISEAWCNVISGLSASEKKKLMLADNKVYELGITDHSAIDEILKELDGNFDIPGYDDSMLEMLTMSFKETDEFVGSYGAFNPADIEKIQNKKVNVSPTVSDASQEAEDKNGYIPGTDDRSAQQPLQPPQGGKFIVCPHCGEQICL